MIPVVFSERSRGDLREIGDYIAQDNPLRSVTFVNELIDKAEAIGHGPNAYPKRDDIRSGLRMALAISEGFSEMDEPVARLAIVARMLVIQGALLIASPSFIWR